MFGFLPQSGCGYKVFFEKGCWKLFRESDHACVELDPIEPQGQGFYSLILHQGAAWVWPGRDTEGVYAEDLFVAEDEDLDGQPLGAGEEEALAAELALLDEEPEEETKEAEGCWVGPWIHSWPLLRYFQAKEFNTWIGYHGLFSTRGMVGS